MRFSPSCSATLLLFKPPLSPIFLSNASGRPRRRAERKRTAMLASIVRFLREWRQYNQSVSELSRLGDRELADIGISRSDIPRVAWNAAHQH
jgi:uncharacterized protein YjiS (DUF1127 family)